MRPILFAGQATARTGLAGVGRLHLHTEGASQYRFVGKGALQLGKRPLGGVPIGLAGSARRRTYCCPYAAHLAAVGPLANTFQLVQADQSVGVRLHNVLAYTVAAVISYCRRAVQVLDEA
jgi:hypothetical protein